MQPDRQMSEKVKQAVRLYNNGGWSMRLAGKMAGVSANAVCNAMTKLKRNHLVILQAYTNLIAD